jgi:hypothetical protein
MGHPDAEVDNATALNARATTPHDRTAGSAQP